MHEVVQEVLLDHPAQRGGVQALGVSRHVLAAVGFDQDRALGSWHEGGKRGQLNEVGRFGVDFRQVRQPLAPAGAVGVAEGGVGSAVAALRRGAGRTLHLAENWVAALRIAADGQGVAVVRSHQNQGVGGVGQGRRLGHRRVQGDGVNQRPIGVAEVVGMVDAPAFYQKEEAPAPVAQPPHGEFGHPRQRRLHLLVAVRLKLHVARLEQAEHLFGLPGLQGVQLLQPPSVGAATAPQPLLHQVPAVGAQAGLVRMFGVRLGGAEEVGAPAAQHHLNAVSRGEFDQLPGKVPAAGGNCVLRHGRVMFPVPVRSVPVGRRRSGVGERRCGDDAGQKALLLRSLQQGGQRLLKAGGAVAARNLRADA